MFFEWLRDRRRKRILETPFPSRWEPFIAASLERRSWLGAGACQHLKDLVQVFVEERNFEGLGGLVLTDEVRLTIAADACILILGLPHDLYRKVDSILVYPSTVVRPERLPGMFEVSRMPVRGAMPILGEAHLGGPVILAWDSVQRAARHPKTGHNVVFHEFAHKLDMFDRTVDGTPPLDSPEDYERWGQVCTASFLALQERAADGVPGVLDTYGAENEAEFFAVATEAFFDLPRRLNEEEPELYEVLASFYHQDPACTQEEPT